MYIKHRNIKDNKIVIININISSCKDIVVENNFLVINMENDKETLKILLENNEMAQLAQEKIFITLGLKAPYNNILDLTNVSEVVSAEMIGLTLNEIAEKLKIDLRELSIVGSPSLAKEKIEEVKIDEEGE